MFINQLSHFSAFFQISIQVFYLLINYFQSDTTIRAILIHL